MKQNRHAIEVKLNNGEATKNLGLFRNFFVTFEIKVSTRYGFQYAESLDHRLELIFFGGDIRDYFS